MKIIGIAGGSGSGKTYLTNQIITEFGIDNFSLIELDSYYKDLSHINFKEREKHNFDHPDSFDFRLLNNHLMELELKKQVFIPIYNYKTHTRMKTEKKIIKNKILIIEGIFAFFNSKLRDYMVYKIFLNIPEKTRLSRRLKRDAINRARTNESIMNQYKNFVIPMHKKYVKPTMKHADIIVSNNMNTKSINILFEKIKNILK